MRLTNEIGARGADRILNAGVLAVAALLVVAACGGKTSDGSGGGGVSGAGGSSAGNDGGPPSCDDGAVPCAFFAERYAECTGADLDWTCPIPPGCDECTIACLYSATCEAVTYYAADPSTGALDFCLDDCASRYHCDDRVIRTWQVCDGCVDCPSGTDELDSECANVDTGYLCKGATQRIPRRDVCNGVGDCPGGDDEAMCSTCRSNNEQCVPTGMACAAFICLDGDGIVPVEALCNGYPELDCANGSDESIEHVCGER